MSHRWIVSLVLLFLTTFFPASASAESVDLVMLQPDLPSGQPVGTPIQWSATSDLTTPSYRLRIARAGEPLRTIYDFGEQATFKWTPLRDGLFIVIADAREPGSPIQSTSALFVVTPRTRAAPVITPTHNPLLALYSSGACPGGHAVRVLYWPIPGGFPSATPWTPCNPAHSNNRYIGGLTEQSLYAMVEQERNAAGVSVRVGPARLFQSGALPAEFSAHTLLDPPGPFTNLAQPLLLMSRVVGEHLYPYATNLSGQVVWYDSQPAAEIPWALRPTASGTYLQSAALNGVKDQLLQERDIGGRILRQTSVQRLNEQLPLLGHSDPLTSFHHEARRLGDGRTVVLGSVERIVEDVQGPGPINILADYLLVLDSDWQLVWAWNAFDHLDLTRVASLNETCVTNQGGCPPIVLAPIANDWTHSNGVAYDPADGNFLISVRHQDWVLKIAYEDGAGNGEVIWRLGAEGDFALSAPSGGSWFDHQHDANVVEAGEIVLYDNGNVRCDGVGAGCNSRGQRYLLDEQGLTAILVYDVDLGVYAPAVGSAQRLSNGNFHFTSGFLGAFPFSAEHGEYRPDGTLVYRLAAGSAHYRGFRVPSLYAVSPLP